MLDRKFTSKGIVVKRLNLKDSDRLLTIFSEKYGKIKVIAKGVRLPKSRKRGHIEIFSHIKFSVSQTVAGFPIMTEAETITTFSNIRLDLKKVAVAYFFMEVVDKITSSEEPNEKVFEVFYAKLTELENSQKLKTLREEFIKEILEVSGFIPKGEGLRELDKVLENVLEKRVSSSRIGKKILS